MPNAYEILSIRPDATAADAVKARNDMVQGEGLFEQLMGRTEGEIDVSEARERMQSLDDALETILTPEKRLKLDFILYKIESSDVDNLLDQLSDPTRNQAAARLLELLESGDKESDALFAEYYIESVFLRALRSHDDLCLKIFSLQPEAFVQAMEPLYKDDFWHDNDLIFKNAGQWLVRILDWLPAKADGDGEIEQMELSASLLFDLDTGRIACAETLSAKLLELSPRDFARTMVPYYLNEIKAGRPGTEKNLLELMNVYPAAGSIIAMNLYGRNFSAQIQNVADRAKALAEPFRRETVSTLTAHFTLHT